MAASVKSAAGFNLAAPYTSTFTAIGDLTGLVDIRFLLARMDRAHETVSYDVTVSNISGRDLLLPLVLELDPLRNYDGEPQGTLGRSAAGTWLIDLSANLPSGVLGAGLATTGQTITVRNPSGRPVAFAPEIGRAHV